MVFTRRLTDGSSRVKGQNAGSDSTSRRQLVRAISAYLNVIKCIYVSGQISVSVTVFAVPSTYACGLCFALGTVSAITVTCSRNTFYTTTYYSVHDTHTENYDGLGAFTSALGRFLEKRIFVVKPDRFSPKRRTRSNSPIRTKSTSAFV